MFKLFIYSLRSLTLSGNIHFHDMTLKKKFLYIFIYGLNLNNLMKVENFEIKFSQIN